MRIDDEVRAAWRRDLDQEIEVVRGLADRYGARLLAADRMFTGLTATTEPERWSEDGVHPTPYGHAESARAWLELVA